MNSLTKKQRHEVYKETLRRVHETFKRDGGVLWMCPKMADAYTALGFNFVEFSDMPEFISKKPDFANLISWFPASKFERPEAYILRVQLLEKCIDETR